MTWPRLPVIVANFQKKTYYKKTYEIKIPVVVYKDKTKNMLHGACI